MVRAIRKLLARFYHLRGMVYRHWGHQYGDQEAYRQAEQDFTRAIALEPAFADALYARGLLRWRELADGTGAVEDLTQVLELKPEWAEAWFNRAMAREVMGDLAGALADFHRYLAEGHDPQWREISQRQIALLQDAVIQEDR